MPQLSEEVLLIIYNYAYVVYKYVNKEVDTEILTEGEKENVASARANPWAYTMQRVEGDKSLRKKYTFLKERMGRLMETGLNFVPA